VCSNVNDVQFSICEQPPMKPTICLSSNATKYFASPLNAMSMKNVSFGQGAAYDASSISQIALRSRTLAALMTIDCSPLMASPLDDRIAPPACAGTRAQTPTGPRTGRPAKLPGCQRMSGTYQRATSCCHAQQRFPAAALQRRQMHRQQFPLICRTSAKTSKSRQTAPDPGCICLSRTSKRSA